MSDMITIIDIDISDLPSDKEYIYKGMINDLFEIPKDASINSLYTFMDDRFIYARKDDHTLYRVMNTPLNLNNRTSDSPSDREAKFDQGKPQLTLVPRQIIFDIAKVREYGVKKYKDPDNWKRVSVDRYRDAAFRHFMSYLDEPYGVDEESGLPHLAHLACNIAFLCELQNEYGFYPDKARDILNRSANVIDTGMPKLSDYYNFEKKEGWKKELEEGLDEDPPAYWYKKGIYPGWLYCSNCDEPWSFDTGAPPYCPCCGKKMMKKEEKTLMNGKE